MRSSVRLMLVVVVQSVVQMACGVKKSACPECGSDYWVRLEDEPFCYQFNTTNVAGDYDNNREHCEGLDGVTLPILKTKSSRDNLKDYAVPTRIGQGIFVFIGLQNILGKGWKWQGSRMETFEDGNIESFFFGRDPPLTKGGNLIILGSHGYDTRTDTPDVTTTHRYCQKQCPLTTPSKPTDKATAADKTTQGGSGGGLGLWVIIGIAAGGVALLLLLIVAAVVLVKRRRTADMQQTPGEPGSQQGGPSGTASQEVTAKGDPSAGMTTKDDPGAGIATKDLFCGTEMDHGIGTKDLFNATEADNASNASLNLASVEK